MATLFTACPGRSSHASDAYGSRQHPSELWGVAMKEPAFKWEVNPTTGMTTGRIVHKSGGHTLARRSKYENKWRGEVTRFVDNKEIESDGSQGQ